MDRGDFDESLLKSILKHLLILLVHMHAHVCVSVHTCVFAGVCEGQKREWWGPLELGRYSCDVGIRILKSGPPD